MLNSWLNLASSLNYFSIKSLPDSLIVTACQIGSRRAITWDQRSFPLLLNHSCYLQKVEVKSKVLMTQVIFQLFYGLCCWFFRRRFVKSKISGNKTAYQLKVNLPFTLCHIIAESIQHLNFNTWHISISNIVNNW